MWILAKILTEITRRPRQKVVAGVDFKWNSKAWVHNCFRAFNLVFWRMEGLRPATSMNVWKDEYGNQQQTIAFHTIESALQHAENYIRGLVPKLVLVKVYIPVLATPGMPVFSSPYLFALAFDNTASSSPAFGSGSSCSATGFTITASNSLIVTNTYSNTTAYDVTSVTSSDGTFTDIANAFLVGNHVSMQYFLGATTTSQTITANFSTTVVFGLQIISYTGAKQSSQPDSSNSGTAATTNTCTASTTVVAANCWLALSAAGQFQAPTAGTGTTMRQNDNVNNGTGIYDSNGTVGTGSQSLVVTSAHSGGDNFAYVVASFAPSVAVAAAIVYPTLSFLGAG